MILDENKLKERLKEKFSDEDVNNILRDLKIEGLPLKVPVSSLDIELGDAVSIKFLNREGNTLIENDLLTLDHWIAKIGNLDPLQIKSIKIPTLEYTNNNRMTLDVTLYPFKMENIFNKKEN